MLAPAHAEWLQALHQLEPEQLMQRAGTVTKYCDQLGIWARGGHVPLHPFCLKQEAVEGLHALVAKLSKALIGFAGHRSGHDLERLADQVGFPETDRWFLPRAWPSPSELGCVRGDVLAGAERAQVIEVNIGGCLSGTSIVDVLSRTFLASPEGARLHELRGLRAESFFEARTEWIREAVPAPSARVAFLGFAADGDEGSTRAFTDEVDFARSRGVASDFVPMEEAAVTNGRLTWGDRSYAGVLRYFMMRAERHHFQDLAEAVEKMAGTRLLGGYACQLFTSKALLADLYQFECRRTGTSWLTQSVPWTARLASSTALRGSETIGVRRWAESHQRELVLKPSNSFGSRGVVVGRSRTPEEWRGDLDQCEVDDYVVQDRVEAEPWPALYWSEVKNELVRSRAPVLLGPFSVGGRAAGVYCQQPVDGTLEDLLDTRWPRSANCAVT